MVDPGGSTSAGHCRPRLLAVGFHVPGTGLTRVMRGILEPLAGEFEIHHLGIGYRGPVIDGAVTVHPCNLSGGDMYGVRRTAELVERLRPTIVLVVNDLWIAAKYPSALAVHEARVVAYCPVDGRIMDERLVAQLAGVSSLVVYTEFGRREVEAAADRLAGTHGHGTFPPVAVIPHGVDTRAFRPLAGTVEAQLNGGRAAAKRRLFPDEPDAEGSFVVLNGNRPQPRKRIDLTVRAFARFAAGKPANVRLVLHNAAFGAEEREAIRTLADRYGVADRVRLTEAGRDPLSDGELNLLYNACDVGLNTAMGEGWGLVAFEHAATGAAQVVPDHSACAELWTGAAEIVECVTRGMPAFSRVEMDVVSVDGVVRALERLYGHREHREAMSRAAYRNATRASYRWERIADRWRALFAETRVPAALALAG